jgi:hypothetical protein
VPALGGVEYTSRGDRAEPICNIFEVSMQSADRLWAKVKCHGGKNTVVKVVLEFRLSVAKLFHDVAVFIINLGRVRREAACNRCSYVNRS